MGVVNGTCTALMYLYIPNQRPFKALYNDCLKLTHLNNRRRSQSCEATASSSGEVGVMCFAQGHLNVQLGGAGDQTSSLQVARQPSLPPEPQTPLLWCGTCVYMCVVSGACVL